MTLPDLRAVAIAEQSAPLPKRRRKRGHAVLKIAHMLEERVEQAESDELLYAEARERRLIAGTERGGLVLRGRDELVQAWRNEDSRRMAGYRAASVRTAGATSLSHLPEPDWQSPHTIVADDAYFERFG
jgi:hypothetical protein